MIVALNGLHMGSEGTCSSGHIIHKALYLKLTTHDGRTAAIPDDLAMILH